MKVAITGASGFLGGHLVPALAETHDLLLVGRDAEKLARAYPDIASCDYDALADRARGFDALLHLAVLNNTSDAAPEAFRSVNVGLFDTVIDSAKEAGIPRLVNVTSFHALDPGKSAYAQSKHEALRLTRAAAGIKITNLFLPYVHDGAMRGRLAALNRLPKPLRDMAFACLSALAPTVSVALVTAWVTRFLGQEIPPKESEESAADVFLADPKSDNLVYAGLRKTLDLGFALTIIVLFCWLLALVWIGVRLSSPGPGLFRQVRVGRAESPFTCLKFRTMHLGTVQAGTHDVPQSAVTGFGQFLRRTKLDELPQAINVLVGDMTLVGPRPCLPTQTDLIIARRRRHVFDEIPGITGLAQVNGITMVDPERLADWDGFYKAAKCTPLDLKLLLRTILPRRDGSGPRDILP